MRTLGQLFKFKKSARSLAVGLLLLTGLLGGCTEPFVKVVVQVDTCQAGGMGKQFGQLDIGACNTGGGTGPIPPPPATVCKNTSGGVIQCPSGATCTSGSKCQSSPGTCTQTRLPCKTYWTESSPGSTNGYCTCQC